MATTSGAAGIHLEFTASSTLDKAIPTASIYTIFQAGQDLRGQQNNEAIKKKTKLQDSIFIGCGIGTLVPQV